MQIHSTVLMVLQQCEETQDKINRHLFFASLHCGLAKCYSMLLTTVQNSSDGTTYKYHAWGIWSKKHQNASWDAWYAKAVFPKLFCSQTPFDFEMYPRVLTYLCPDDSDPKLKIYISDLISDSYQYIPVA